MKRILFLNLLLIGFITRVSAQNVFDPNDPIVRYSSSAAYGSAQKPDTNVAGLQKWICASTSGVSSGSGNFATLAATFKPYFIRYWDTRLAFRIKFPNSFNNPDSANKKYPVALFLHGAGEVGCNSNGGIYNNEKQLVLGGKVFGQRVDNNQFDGFLLYPQYRATDNGCWGEWGSGPNQWYNTIITIIDSMAKYVRADIDRVFTYGLSGGGIGTWEMAENYPTRIAKIAPTSAAGVPLAWTNLIHIPIWLATGGKDTNPTPDMAQYTYTNISTNLGGDMRKSLYADLGHSSWDRHWAEPDFVPFMNDVHKANPLIFFNRFEFCPDATVSAKLGITARFYDYEWRKDGALIATSYGTGNPANNTRTNTVLNSSAVSNFGSGGNEITIKQFGVYDVRFRRVPGGPWSEWSRKPAAITPKTITQTPPIAITGVNSKVLPSLDGKTKVQLELPDGFLNYQWVRTSDNVVVSTSRLFDAPVGSYKARYSEPYGCGTEYSPVFNVVNASGSPKPDAAKNLSVSAISQTALRLDWSDNANAGTNETGFEIYRSKVEGGPYTLINITAANAVTYQDNNLTPNTTYYYLVRAVAETGAAAASNEASGKTEIDDIAPTAPADLEYRGSTSTTVSLRWKAATDNAAIGRYDIYANGQKLYSTTNLSFIVANLDSLTSYTFFVKAVDKAGNASSNSNQVIGYTHRQGLNYNFYTGSFGNNLPNFSNLTPVKSGIMDTVNAGAGIRTQDDNFAFKWEGQIYIPVNGTWTFETSSDDGSKLYIDVPYGFNTTPLINNDGAHGVTSVSASRYLTAGYHSIVITFAEIGGGEEMNLFWSNNVGLARERIPKRFFSIGDSYTSVAVNAPSSFVATATAYNKIVLNWTDNSNNETGFEIVRSTSLNGSYVPVTTVPANTVTYTDSGLTAATRYFYKVRSVAEAGVSDFVNSFGEANWKFNNNYNEANSGPSISASNTSFSTDRAEGSHSVSFNSSDYINMNGNATTFPSMGGYNQRTVALWLKTTSTNSKRMIFEIGSNDNGLGLRFNSDDLEAGIASGGSSLFVARLSNFANNGNWSTTGWNHVAVVYNINSLKLYLNGVEVASNTSLTFTSMGNSSNSSRIGQPSGSGSSNVFNDGSLLTGTYSNYAGLLDNMYVIRGALSEADLLELKNNDVLKISSATTLAAPATPSIPNSVSATVLSTNAIRIAFNDNSANETGFEVWRSSGDKSNNRKIATLPAGNGGEIQFTDSSLFANTTYYFTVRATGVTSNSAFSAEVNGKTLNTKPVITKVLDFTMRYSTVFVLPIKAVDADGEVLNFSTVNLPVFATLQPVSNGNMNITFSPGTRQRGTYTITVIVNDQNNGKDTAKFMLTVNTNDVPVISALPETVNLKEGDQLTIPVSATDNNGTALMIWSTSNLPPFVTFTNNNNGSGTLLLKPGYTASGDYEFGISVDDGYEAWSQKTIRVSIADREPDELVQFDFRSTSPEVAGWNSVNVVSPGFSHGAVYSVKGNLSYMALTLMKGTMAFSTNGPNTGANTGVFPDNVLKDNMTWGFNTTNNLNDTAIIKVSGLNQYNTYNFTFNGAQNVNATVQYKIGGQTVSYNLVNNITGLTISNVQPDAQGEVLITMIGEVNTTRGGAISGLVIKSNYEDGTTPAKPTGFSGVHTSTGVRLAWIDKAYNEAAYRVYRSGVKTGPYDLLNPGSNNRDSSGYTDATIAPETTYYYYVVGVNSFGTGASSDTIKVITGNNTPVIVAPANIYAKTGTTENVDFTVTDDAADVVTVTLTEKPKFVSLENLGGANYRIVANASTDHIGWYTVKVKAEDNKGAVIEKVIALTVSDKNTKSVYINFGNAATNAPAPWNNWLGTRTAGSFIDALKDERNTATAIRVTANNAWTVLNDLGHVTGNNSGVVPDSVLASGIVDNTSTRTFTITGLDNSKRYNVVFVGSLNEGTNANVEYSSGTVLDTLNAKYNTNQTANVNGLTPVGGQLVVNLRRIVASDVNYLNAMIIEEYDPLITILNPLNLKAEPFNRNSIDLTWSDRTRDEATADGYVLERATDSLFTLNNVTIELPANTTVYRNTGLSPNTKYWYRLRAKTAGGMFSDYSNRAKAITPAAIVYVDFNYTLPIAEYPWNSFESPAIAGNVLDSMITTTGAVSGLSLEMTRVFNGEFTAGVNTGNNSGIVSDKALASNYWLDKTQLSSFRLTGLNHSRKYRIGFFGSSSSAGWFKGNYTATYTINGRTVYLNSWMNSSKIVYIDDVIADEAGGVDIDFSTTETAMYGFNSGIIIQDYTDPDNPNSGFVINNSILTDDEAGVALVDADNEAAAARVANTTGAGRLYPNPFTDIVNIDFDNASAGNNISVEIYDLAGRMSYRKQFGKLPKGANTLKVNAGDSGMELGVYIVTLSVNGKPFQATKVVRTGK